MSWQAIKTKAIGAAWGIATLGAFSLVHATGSTVAKVGTYEIQLSEVQKRLGKLPLFQLKQLGTSPDTVRRRFVDEIVKLEIMVQGARLEGLDELPDVSERIRVVMVSALLNGLASDAATDGVVSDAKARAYYDANSERYKPENRIKIWQIAVKTKVEAEALLKTIGSGDGFKNESTFVDAWEALAREKSVDKATYMRRGTLGFVQPDGATANKDVRVPKAVYDAAASIKNGEIYPQPLQVESSWIVLTRRGSQITPHRTFESERSNILGFLARQHVVTRRRALVERLRTDHMHEKNERVLDQLSVSDAEITVSRRPGTLRKARSPRGKGRPVGKPGDLR